MIPPAEPPIGRTTIDGHEVTVTAEGKFQVQIRGKHLTFRTLAEAKREIATRETTRGVRVMVIHAWKDEVDVREVVRARPRRGGGYDFFDRDDVNLSEYSRVCLYSPPLYHQLVENRRQHQALDEEYQRLVDATIPLTPEALGASGRPEGTETE